MHKVGNTVPSPPAAFTLIWNHGSHPPKRQGPGHPSHRIHGHSRPRAYEPGTEHGYTVLHSISSNCYSTTTATTTIHAMQQGAEPGARATHDMIAARPPDPPILPLASVWCAPDATLDRRAPPFPLQVLPPGWPPPCRPWPPLRSGGALRRTPISFLFLTKARRARSPRTGALSQLPFDAYSSRSYYPILTLLRVRCRCRFSSRGSSAFESPSCSCAKCATDGPKGRSTKTVARRHLPGTITLRPRCPVLPPAIHLRCVWGSSPTR